MIFMKGKLVRCLTTATMITMLATGFSINTEAATQPKLNKTKITITEGKSYSLKVRGISSKVKVTWKSSKKSVASVTSKGRITARKGGVSVVSARFSYKKSGKKVTKTLKCKVNVKAKRVQATKTPKPTSTPKPTATPTVKPTNTVAPTATPTVEPTATSTPAPTATPEVVQATATPTPTETVEPTEVPVVIEPTTVPTEAPTESPIHVHDYNARYEMVKKSTCTEEGLVNLYCECGECIQKVIEPQHTKIGVVQDDAYHCSPTETTGGYLNADCADCGVDFKIEFPALTEENYPLDGWVYEKHDYMYPEEIREKYGWYKVDRHHNAPYILVTDYIGTKENPTLKGSYVIDGVEYQVITRTLKCSSPTVQSFRFYGVRCENPDMSAVFEKGIAYYALTGEDCYADFDWSL